MLLYAYGFHSLTMQPQSFCRSNPTQIKTTLKLVRSGINGLKKCAKLTFLNSKLELWLKTARIFEYGED